MKIIKKDLNEWDLILENGDLINLCSMYKNKEKLQIRCTDSSIHIDEIDAKDIKLMSIENEEIKKMQKINNENKKNE